ncbi:MAG TPA: hypothetical protein VNU26_01390, partial [Mycobacteriales bacterium]|nr:hypothetical protein [Mycobacteriales bacterium]
MEAARRERLARQPGRVPASAIVGDVGAPALQAVRAAGWRVTGVLDPDPFSGTLADRVGYLDADELLVDGRVDVAVVAGDDGGAASLLPALRGAGLRVLLPSPAPLDVALLRRALDVDGPATAVGLLERWAPWARTVRAALPLAGTPVQVTVRGWPPGPQAAAEMADLVRLWCGEVVAVAAPPAPLPAAVLPDGVPVAWSLLTACGATVLVAGLVAGADGGPLVRLSTASARLEAGPAGVRWVGGAELPLQQLPPSLPVPPEGVPPGLLATAVLLGR